MINIGIDPIAFLTVRWYGIMIALGIMVLIAWAAWQVKKGAKVTYDTVFTAALVAIPSGVIVSRLLHVIDLWGYYSQHPAEIIGGSGLTIYGAVLGATLGLWLYSHFSKVNFGYFADLLAPGVILAQAVGRVGCTINGCCYGTPSQLPWSIVYTHPDSQVAPDLHGVSLQPTTVYEIIYLLAIFGFTYVLRKRVKPEGSLFLIYLSLYSAWRVGIDFLREGSSFLFGLHQAQVIGIIVLAITIPVLVVRMRRAKTQTEEVPVPTTE